MKLKETSHGQLINYLLGTCLEEDSQGGPGMAVYGRVKIFQWG